MKLSILQNIGLSPSEIEVYDALFSLNKSRIGPIIAKTGLSSSNVHAAISKLVDKGLASFVKVNNIKHFMATDPEYLMTLYDQEEEKLQDTKSQLTKTIDQLKEAKDLTKLATGDAEVFFGFTGIKNGLLKIIKQMGKDDILKFFYIPVEADLQRVHEFYSKLDLNTKYHNSIPTRGLCAPSYRPYFKQRTRSKVQVRYTELPIPSNVNVLGSYTLIVQFVSDIPTAFVINSKEISGMFNNMHDTIWEQSEL